MIGSLCSWWVIGLRGCRREAGELGVEEAAGCQETQKAGRHVRNSGGKTGSRIFFSFFPPSPPLVSDEDVEGGEAGERGLQRVSD